MQEFYKEDSRVVSVWASKVGSLQIPKGYFRAIYDENEESSIQFAQDFGIEYYDTGFSERADRYGDTNIERLRFASFGESFCKSASSACGEERVECFFLIYDFDYDPNVSGVSESEYFKFVGSFEFDTSA